MTNTIEQAVAYARAHPQNASETSGTWHLWCEAFVYRAGGFNRSFPTATAAGDASGPMSQGPAPRGAIHWWGNGDGHVGFELGGGLILMASNGVTTSWGNAVGTATLAEYRAAKPTPTYRGWTLRHGTETLEPSAASLAFTTLSPLTQKDAATIMALKDTLEIFKCDALGYVVIGSGFTREIIGTERLDALTSAPLNIPVTDLGSDQRKWQVLAEFFRGSDELGLVLAGVKDSLDK